MNLCPAVMPHRGCVTDMPCCWYRPSRNGTYISAAGQSFRDFMGGRLPALPGELPTKKDWENHLTTIFPEVGFGGGGVCG